MRYAIWSAVSTKDQATDDKASLRVQVDECRAVASAKGWQETSGPYIVRGASRTRWANLRDAETAVPELRAMLDAAQARAFDVLMVKDYDRFRELMDQVYRTLIDYNVQLYSLTQPLEPAPPDKFDPYDSDTQELLISFSQMRSRTEIRTTRRRYRMGMPSRITTHGLPLKIPYAYRKPPGREADRRAIPLPDDSLTPFLLAIKDLFLTGQSTRQLVDYLNDSNAPTPNGQQSWNQVTVRELLRNPFYAGLVRFGASKSHLDRRTGKRTRENGLPGITAAGKHTPLWDLETHTAIMAEFDHRKQRYSGRRANTLSGLLVCGECGKTMWLSYQGQGKRTHHPDYITWRCGSRQPGHPAIKNPVALRLLLDELKRALSTDQPARPATDSASIHAQLLDLTQRRTRISNAYDDGAYDLSEWHRRADPIDAQITNLTKQLTEHGYQAAADRERAQLIQTLLTRLDQLDSIILGDNRLQDVNHALKSLLQSVVIIDAETIKITLK
jgi:DNA invertase Pin-like site-specific DNA recombinase